MRVDLLRAGYRTRMRLWADDPDLETEIRWFRTAPGAQLFAGPTAFRSQYFNPEPGPRPLGEVFGAPRVFDKGDNPVGYLGTQFCGREVDWEIGGAFGRSNLIITDPDGWATCCRRPNEMPVGGLALTGSAVFFSHWQEPSGGLALTGSAVQAGGEGQVGEGGLGVTGSGFGGIMEGAGGLALAGSALFPQVGGGGLGVTGSATFGGSEGPQYGTGGLGLTGAATISLNPTISNYTNNWYVTSSTWVGDKPTGAASGDLLLCAIQINSTNVAGVTLPSGWVTLQAFQTDAASGLWVGYKHLGSSEPSTYTFTFPTAGNCTGVMLLIKGQCANPTSANFATLPSPGTRPTGSVSVTKNGALGLSFVHATAFDFAASWVSPTTMYGLFGFASPQMSLMIGTRGPFLNGNTMSSNYTVSTTGSVRSATVVVQRP